jgi:hypothetical protein
MKYRATVQEVYAGRRAMQGMNLFRILRWPFQDFFVLAQRVGLAEELVPWAQAPLENIEKERPAYFHITSSKVRTEFPLNL